MNKTGRVAFGVLLATLLATVVVCDIDSASASQFGLNYSAFIEQSNTIVLPNNDPSLSITPSSAGATGTTNFNVTVYSNSSSGYTLTLSAADTSLSGESSGGSIDTVTETATSLSGIQANHWGVNIPGTDLNHESGYYYAMASSSAPFTLINSNAATGQSGRSVTINAGAKLDLATPADTYSTTLNFAVVSAPAPISILDMHDMQDFASLTPAEMSSVIDSMGTEINYAIGDSRDTGTNDTARYTIAKLRDGKVWMTTNLDLAGGTQLTHADTNIPENYTIDATGFTNNTLPASSTSGFSDNSTAYVYNSNSTTCGNNSPCYSYYSWLTATVGGKDANGNAVTSDGYNAAYSICPAGWRLPTATTSNAPAQTSPNWKTGDSYKLATAYGANLEGNYHDDSSSTGANFKNNAGPTTDIPKFLLGGYYFNSAFYVGGSIGYYWSATSYSSSNAYYLRFDSSFVNSADYSSRRLGFSVRCILDNPVDDISEIEYMQDFATLSSEQKTSVINSMTPNTNYALKDSRDGANATARYTIAKLVRSTTVNNNPFNYSEVWMTTNLDLAGGTQLTHADTDIPEGYTIDATGFTNNTLPASSTSGFNDASTAFVYNSGTTTCVDENPCYSYYSWTAATAGGKDASGNAVADYYNAPYSICPAGWRLPTSSTSNASATSYPNWKTGDFYKLATAYGAYLEIESGDDSAAIGGNSGANFNNNAGPTSTLPRFLLGGKYHDSTFRREGFGGYNGHYWSATSYSNDKACELLFASWMVSAPYVSNRGDGFSVRCILRE